MLVVYGLYTSASQHVSVVFLGVLFFVLMSRLIAASYCIFLFYRESFSASCTDLSRIIFAISKQEKNTLCELICLSFLHCIGFTIVGLNGYDIPVRVMYFWLQGWHLLMFSTSFFYHHRSI